MKTFNTYIIEKLKISKKLNKKFNDFDDEPVGDLTTTISCTLNFVLYFQERTKSENIDFDMNLYFGNGYVECGEKRSLAENICNYSETDTFDELYNRIIDALIYNGLIEDERF